MVFEIEWIFVFSDNYMYLFYDLGFGVIVVVDLVEIGLILVKFEQKGWEFDFILSMYYYLDYVVGNFEFKEKIGCVIFGLVVECDKIFGFDIVFFEGDCVGVGIEEVIVYEMLGYMVGYISYWFEGFLVFFCVDMFFVLGCGCLFEGILVQMWDLMQKYLYMFDDICVFCGYEYIQSNVYFVVIVDLDNVVLCMCVVEIDCLWQVDELIVLSLFGEECVMNFFFCLYDVGICVVFDMVDVIDVEVFGEFCFRKDNV